MDDRLPSPLVRAGASVEGSAPRRAGRWLLGFWPWVIIACLVPAGCQSPRPRDPATMSPVFAPVTTPDYRVVFPDILEVSVPERPDSSGRFLVMPDGSLELGRLGSVAAEGKTVDELARKIATMAGLAEGQVGCRVSQHGSRVVHVFGPEGATPGTLPYAGTERVTDVLNRAGVAGHQNLAEVQVIRRNTATGRPPETFRVDLTAIRAGDFETNLILEPNDEIRLTESHPSLISRTIPEWLKPGSDR